MTKLAHRELPPTPRDVALARSSGQRLARYVDAGRPLRLHIRQAGQDEAIELPAGVAGLLIDMLAAMAAGRGVTLVPEDAELTTVQAATVLPEVPLISTITLAELSLGPLVARSDMERAARQAVLQQAEADFEPLPFDDRAARAFGRLTASLRTSGRTVKARSYDAMVAAIAIANDLPLYTANAHDFAGIDGLDVRAVPTP